MKQTLAGFDVSARMRQLSAFAQAAVLALAMTLPLLVAGQASAVQLTDRKVTIDSSVVSHTNTNYNFTFSFASTAVQGVVFQFCTTPLGTCTLPTGMNVNHTLTSLAGDTGFQGGSNTFTEYTTNGTGECNDNGGTSAGTMYCISRSNTNAAAGTGATVNIAGVTNPSSIIS